MIKLINILKELITATEIICDKCGWEWDIKKGGNDLYICHKCNHDNTPVDILKEECWKGYEQIGMKDKNGKQVPNCVPIKEESSTELQFPNGFQPAKPVPNGGAMCANCAKWNKDKQLCEGQYYINWHGNGKIPAEPTEYVCIWWVDKKK